jgi:uncharacterized protein YihD (DUF1040 family)
MTLPLENKVKTDLLRALGHLNYSFKKITQLALLSKQDWTEEELEVLESFASRFARASDLYLSQYLRHLVLQKDPGFRGSFIDLLNLAEKTSLIDSAATWFRIRALRNMAAHDYVAADLKGLYQELFALTSTLIGITSHL